ncbi:22453_t:CDS:2, partial [Racocetra persica]
NTNFLEYEFKKKEKIGSGSFGTVYKSFSQKLNKDVALKMFREYISKENENPKEEIIDEIKIMSERELVHVNIIQLFGITQDPDTKDYGLVLQYANQGTLRAYLETHFSKLEWPDKFRMAREIASGINYLHSKKIVHRDLHDKNVLVHNDSLIVADFGLSKLSDNTSKTHIHPNGFPAY